MQRKPPAVRPQVRIPLLMWQKMMAYVTACPVEINGFGLVSFVDPRTIVVEDVFILDQTATVASVETDPAAIARHMYEMQQAGGDPGKIKLQWHSHVTMPTFFSQTDWENIEDWPGDWLLSLVLNQSGESACRLDFLRPIRAGYEIEPVIDAGLPDGLAAAAANEVADKVTQPRWAGLGKKSLTNGQPADDAWTPVLPTALAVE